MKLPSDIQKSHDSLASRALRKIKKDKLALISFGVVLIFFIIAIGVRFFGWAQGWDELIESGWTEPSGKHWFGTNRNGQDIFKRTLFGTRTAFELGIIVALCSTILGGIFGCLAGFFSGSWLDEIIIWIYGVLDSIPFFLFVAAVAFALKDNPWAMHVAMISTFWTSTARLVRGEVIKLKHLEFVEAAHALGIHRLRIIFRHILPNTTHILTVQSTIIFVTAIKSEVILSFLGIGIKDGVSWGLMLAEAASEAPAGHFNNLLAASLFMFVLVMAFNLFSDALQDALDPRKVSA